MSNHLKSQLLIATGLVGLSISTAHAQAVFPAPTAANVGGSAVAAELRGIGASSIQVVLPREANCIAGAENYGTNSSNGTNAVPEGFFGGSPAFSCQLQSIQPNIKTRYLSTGSGTGKGQFTTWTTSGTSFPTAWGSNWDHAHYAMSDSPMSSSEITAYNTNLRDNAARSTGALIQVPLYVLPVAFAYNPVYGVKTVGTAVTEYKFNVAQPVLDTFIDTAGLTETGTVGGLRMDKTTYCKIWNGDITNWNDAAIGALNTTTKAVAVSLKDANDDATRWATEGAPIRLVGRLDASGTTDIFTRHLAAVCTGVATTNYFTQAAESLPYNTSSGISLNTFRADTRYTTTVTNGATRYAGSVNRISGAVFDNNAINTNQGAEQAGLFLVAAGSGGVAAAVNFAADQTSSVDGTVKLNGKLGYIGADNVLPAPVLSAPLHSAALLSSTKSEAGKTLWAMPSAANATLAFNSTSKTNDVRPPQSTAAGKYATGANAGGTAALDRALATSWYNALYLTAGNLSAPKAGYPVTGTTQFNTGTCFADAATRNALVFFLNARLGNVKLDAANGKVGAIFTSTGKGKLGIGQQIGIASLPKPWVNAITQTFLVRSKEKDELKAVLGDRNLYIQNGLPSKKSVLKDGRTSLTSADLNAITATSLVKGKTVYNEAGPNPLCAAGLGL